MLFTRECDYSVRILRALAGGEMLSVQEISGREDISVSIAYKLARKLEKAGLIRSYRGAKGGYALRASLDEITLYDVFSVVDTDLFLTSCVGGGFACSRNTSDAPCLVHHEFCRLQELLTRELQSKSLAKILSETH